MALFRSGFAILVVGGALELGWNDGATVATFAAASGELVRGPASSAGKLYFTGAGLYSVSGEGPGTWRRLESQAALSSPALGSNGLVYAIGEDRHLYALDAATGSQVFMTRELLEPPSSLSSPRGVGETAVVSTAEGESIAFDRDGLLLGALRSEDGGALAFFLAGPALGLVGTQATPSGRRAVVLDKCGAQRWVTDSSEGIVPRLVGFDDELLMLETDASGNNRRSVVYASDGRRLAGPSEIGEPYLYGADGTLYSVRCSDSGAVDLVASDRLLVQQWTLPLDASCPTAATLSLDGTLVLVGESVAGNEFLSVQTRSPGIAPTAWPTINGSGGASMWVQ